jgi:hypothetical protein
MQHTKQQMDTKAAEVGRYSSKLSHDKDYRLFKF